jgi:thiol-disulfide isomerase/thioredoxin
MSDRRSVLHTPARAADSCKVSRVRRRLIVASGLGLLAASTGVGRAFAQAEATSGAQHRKWPASRPTPSLALPAWDGPAFNLVAQRGKVVVLNFWASWCAPCRAELPSLELLAESRAAQGLVVQAINFRETDGAIRRFLEQSPLSLPILRDVDGGAAKDWQVRIFPTTVVIGRNGRAAFSVTGEVDWSGSTPRQWIASVL